MRTTIRLDDELLREVKAMAAREGRSLTSFIEDALRQAVTPPSAAAEQGRYVVPVFDSRVRAGVDLDSNADLLDLMESQ